LRSTLRTHDLTKSYGGRTVVRGVNLDVASGEIVGLLGPNGAGKTTTFYMTVGLTAPDSGRVELDGHDVTDDPMYIRARKGIGYLPQEPSIFRGLTVEQNRSRFSRRWASTARRGGPGCASCSPS
jgi:lipopolysaccharide export system ATP-binding protein